jgi:hypothetical protein
MDTYRYCCCLEEADALEKDSAVARACGHGICVRADDNAIDARQGRQAKERDPELGIDKGDIAVPGRNGD